MLFHLLTSFRDQFTPLNVFRYPSFRVVVAMITALIVTMVLYPWFIRQLQTRQIGQVVRDELTEHAAKKNTPTMGGILILVAMLMSTLLWSDLTNPLVWIVVLVTAALGVVGFIDDVFKLGKRGHKGLSEKGKLVLQFAICGGAMSWLVWGTSVGFTTEMAFPFVSVDRFTLTLPAFAYVGFTTFVVVGTSNAVNLTDGLDGLAIGPVILAAATFGVLAYLSATTLSYPYEVDGRTVWTSFDLAAYLKISRVDGAVELAIFCSAMIGASIGFLWYNSAPAQVFMGDVGSLALGGALGMVAVLTKNELLSAIIHGLFLFEALSVLIQRYYFRATGKRIFRMAPVHHHFQKLGWAEPKIVIRFWIVSLLLCLLALASLKLR